MTLAELHAAHYRRAAGAYPQPRRCGNCRFYGVAFARCRMFDVTVSPDHVCDKWSSRPAKPTRKRR